MGGIYAELAVFVGVIAVAILGTVLWALTRPADRIQLATLCLFVSTLSLAASAWQFFSKGALLLQGLGVLLGVVAALLYVAMAALALDYKRWAWQLAMGGFTVHLLLTATAGMVHAVQGNFTVMFLATGWLLVDLTGLWACMHRGSRALVKRENSSATSPSRHQDD